MDAFLPHRCAPPDPVADPLYLAQVRELLQVRTPSRRPTDEEVARWAGADPSTAGVWWHYPWRATTVQLLDEAAYREVRESRNRYKITRDEAVTLRGKRVAVLGLSVGQAILVTLAMEGSAGALRFADPDTLDLSNLNRLRASVLDLGKPKWLIAARAVSELDPYVTLEPWTERVSPENVLAFLQGVDVLVEECDDLEIKLLVRAAARRLRIPVVMHTSDRGLLDVERFDLEPDRPLFHGLVGDLDAATLRGLKASEKVPVVARILGEPSVRSAVTLPEVGQSVVSWPQLAAEVSAGAGSTTEVVRRLLLGEAIPSGRWVLDPERALSTRPLYTTPVTAPLAPPLLMPAGLPAADDAVAYVVTAASLAPSAHNVQPWRFVAVGDEIQGHRVPSRWQSALDPDNVVLDAMMGSALENLVIASAALGHGVRVRVGDGDLVWSASFSGAVRADPLAAAIGARHTNRRLPDRRAIAPARLEELQAQAAVHGSRLLLTVPDAGLGQVCAAATRIVALDSRFHEEMMSQLRWDRAEVEATRDGLDVDTLELDGAQRVGLRLFTNPHVARASGVLGLGRRIGTDVGENVATAPCAALLVMSGRGRAAALDAGRALQRVWLQATLAGLSVYPMAGFPQLWSFARTGEVTPSVREELERHRTVWRRHFDLPDDAPELILLRLAYAPAVTARSVRRPLSELLERTHG